MFCIYLEETMVGQLRNPTTGELIVLFVPEHYELLTRHKDYIEAYTKASSMQGRAVVLFQGQEPDRVPKQLSIPDALEKARKTLRDLGAEVK